MVVALAAANQQSWLTYLTVLGIVAAVVLIVGIMGNLFPSKAHTAAGNALMHAETFFRPSREHVIDAKLTEERHDDGEGDPPASGL